ncbi:hypothetical protein PB01_16270 [Psychrobacillus glaciei]|uniref:Uncharacterized protein n=1 Tax=Psychrobacillus glaciei TaxID=2283160 RepID=A0A5J6SVC9_9BACI|nr:hypothetical protein [Psychrobacillus glaciei]QFG00238.1 hypothetical protein PB01_16270 [Psychrobacillus glaciei]
MKFFKWFLVLGSMLMLPWIVWLLSDEKQLHVAVLNKTVPEGDISGHQGFYWLLNYMKIKDNTNKSYNSKLDYFGLSFANGTYKEEKLPSDLSDFDLINIIDTYGVDKENVSSGMTDEEWTSIQSSNEDNDTTLVMEYNSVSAPTNDRVREKATNYLGVKQTGWIAKYTTSLAKKDGEVPTWVLNDYKNTHNSDWTFEGEGIIFHQELTGKVEVLSVNAGTLNEQGLHFHMTNLGEKDFSLSKNHLYTDWFDIVVPNDGADVLAEFKLDTTSEGEKIIQKIGLLSEVPAIVRKRQTLANSYYFTGSFSNVEKVPSLYKYKGFTKIREWSTVDFLFPGDSFYWQVYVPIMKSILHEVETNSGKREQKDKTVATLKTKEGLMYNTRINENKFEVYRNDKWESITIKGVNLGMGKPGAFPGEAAISREEYARWFEYIGKMNANAIRVYTLHPPAFYKALKHYNETHENPIYVFHGVWIDEAPLEETLDAYTPAITKEFQHEYKQMVDVIHGKAEVPTKVGHAHGTYDTDISPYVIGWMIGIEWYPIMVDNMKTEYANLPQYKGNYIETNEAEGFEIWLAEQMDTLMTYEAQQYKWTRPMSFTNWVSTDNIDQPAEPLEQEDLASVDPNHMHIKEGLELPGLFASYHVYPYYPDFLNLDEKYTEYIDQRGNKNNYAGYLHDLRSHHSMPILIAEFGIPASRGITHLNQFGWNQGGHSEKEQGKILASLYEDILAEDMMGGLVFSWQDEWFKRTWNTTDLDDPDRRPFWSNLQTNEQNFGLLSFNTLKIKLDGKVNDWKGIDPIYQSTDGPIQSVYITNDEAYLYLRIDKKSSNKDEDWFKNNKVNILFDISPKSGSSTINENPLIQTDRPVIDFWANIQDKTKANLLVDSYYDPYLYQYGHVLNMLPGKESIPTTNSGVFNPIRYALNKGVVRPDTGQVIPFEGYETGKLVLGNGNPKDSNYNSLSDYFADEKSGVFEMRIPWLLLNIKDPSSKEVLPDMYKDGLEGNVEVKDIGVAFVFESEEGVTSFPDRKNNKIEADKMARYNWEKWTSPYSKERLKQSYFILQQEFKMIK